MADATRFQILTLPGRPWAEYRAQVLHVEELGFDIRDLVPSERSHALTRRGPESTAGSATCPRCSCSRSALRWPTASTKSSGDRTNSSRAATEAALSVIRSVVRRVRREEPLARRRLRVAEEPLDR